MTTARAHSPHWLQLSMERNTSARDGRVTWFAGQEEAGHSERVVPPYELNLLTNGGPADRVPKQERAQIFFSRAWLVN